VECSLSIVAVDSDRHGPLRRCDIGREGDGEQQLEGEHHHLVQAIDFNLVDAAAKPVVVVHIDAEVSGCDR
jgi:hypothetical protein